jgi:hypothetical protein
VLDLLLTGVATGQCFSWRIPSDIAMVSKWNCLGYQSCSFVLFFMCAFISLSLYIGYMGFPVYGCPSAIGGCSKYMSVFSA